MQKERGRESDKGKVEEIPNQRAKPREVAGLGRVEGKNKDRVRCKRAWRGRRWCKIFRRVIVLSWVVKGSKEEKTVVITTRTGSAYHLEQNVELQGFVVFTSPKVFVSSPGQPHRTSDAGESQNPALSPIRLQTSSFLTVGDKPVFIVITDLREFITQVLLLTFMAETLNINSNTKSRQLSVYTSTIKLCALRVEKCCKKLTQEAQKNSVNVSSCPVSSAFSPAVCPVTPPHNPSFPFT